MVAQYFRWFLTHSSHLLGHFPSFERLCLSYLQSSPVKVAACACADLHSAADLQNGFGGRQRLQGAILQSSCPSTAPSPAIFADRRVQDQPRIARRRARAGNTFICSLDSLANMNPECKSSVSAKCGRQLQSSHKILTADMYGRDTTQNWRQWSEPAASL